MSFGVGEKGSMDAIGQGSPHRNAGLECTQDRHGFDGCEGQFWRDVVGDAREADDLNSQTLARGYGALEVSAAVVLEAHGQCSARDGLVERVGVERELVPKSRSDEVGAIRVETFLDEKVDVPEIDHADIDRHLFGFACPLPRFNHARAVFHAIQLESNGIPIGA